MNTIFKDPAEIKTKFTTQIKERYIMPGMILYGYDRENADKLKVEIGGLLETKIEIFSACGLEEITIENMLDKSLSGKFENKDRKIIKS